jgi:TRAP-type mannitol/chloroaromatic compound transport system permease small subunit
MMKRERCNRLKKAGKLLASLFDRITFVCLASSGAMILVMACIDTYGVARRYVFTNPDPYVYTSINILMLGCAVFALAHVERLGRHIRVSFVTGRLSDKAQEILQNIIGPILGLTFCLTVIWMSWNDAWFSLQIKQTTSGIVKIPSFPIKMMVPVGLGLLCLALISKISRYVVSLRSKAEKVKP